MSESTDPLLSVFRYGLPFTANNYAAWERPQRRAMTRQYRHDFKLLAAKGFEIAEPTIIRVVHHRPDRRSFPDVGSTFFAAKAAIDGLVDAGIFEDDDPRFVTELRFPTAVVSGFHGMTVEVHPCTKS